MNRTVVFLGPTLPVTQARMLLPAATYLPPARMGDVYRVVSNAEVSRIAIIDGYFDSVPAVWHTEVLFALAQGVAVFGAASMGALRAAELHPFGMQGVGWVYDRYRTGRINDDDEVALLHSDSESMYRPLSTPMVCLREGLERATQRGLIPATSRDALLSLAKQRFYQHRSWHQLYQDARGAGLLEDDVAALTTFVLTERPDIKRDDACKLLRRLSDDGTTRRGDAPRASFFPTAFWDKLVRTETQPATPSSTQVRQAALHRFVRATDPTLPDLLRSSLLLHLAKVECDAMGINITQDELDAVFRDFRLKHGLTSGEAVRHWLERSGLTADQLQCIMTAHARVAKLIELLRTDTDVHLTAALALSNRLGETVQRYIAVEQRASVTHLPRPSLPQVAEFYRSEVRPYSGSVQHLARELGLRSTGELIDEIAKVYEPVSRSKDQ